MTDHSARSYGCWPVVALAALGRFGVHFARVIPHLLRPWRQAHAGLGQLHFIGLRSLLVIAVAGGFVGMVIALQFHDSLTRSGAASLLGAAVGLSLVRELAPVLSALLLIGRVGSAMCAELGIMRSDQQIDALECMAIDPYGYLIAPRFLATVLALPLLTAVFIVVGIGGGWLVAAVQFHGNSAAYFLGMQDAIVAHDLTMSAVKAGVFAVIIVWICSGYGYLMHCAEQPLFGAEGVSRTTTDAVVATSIAVLFADYIISALMA